MLHVLARHKVEDYSAWKRTFDAAADLRRKSGEQSFLILHPNGDPNDLVLLFEWDTAVNARKFMESKELRQAMQESGVIGTPAIELLEKADSGALRDLEMTAKSGK